MELSKKMLIAYMRKYNISKKILSRMLGISVDDINQMLDDNQILLTERSARRFIYAVGITAALEIMLNKNMEVMQFEREYRATHNAYAY